MFNRKSQKVTVPVVETRQVSVPTVAGIKSAIAPVASRAKSLIDEQAQHGKALAAPKIENARSVVAPHLEDARSAVAPHLEEARAAVAPRLADAKATMAPRIADARHHVEADYLPKLVEAKDQLAHDTLPKVAAAMSSALGGSQLANSGALRRISDSEAAHRAADAARVLRGEAVATTKKTGRTFFSGLMATLGILGAAGAAAWFFNKRAAEQDDPWARPLAEPYIDDVATSTHVGVDTYEPAAGQVSEASSYEGEQIPTGSEAGWKAGAPGAATDESVMGADASSGSVAGTDAASGSVAGSDSGGVPAEESVIGGDSANDSVAGTDAASGSIAGEDGQRESRNF